jgi:hypothetical protein
VFLRQLNVDGENKRYMSSRKLPNNFMDFKGIWILEKMYKITQITISQKCEQSVARALTPYPGDLNHYRSCTPASEDGLKETP